MHVPNSQNMSKSKYNFMCGHYYRAEGGYYYEITWNNNLKWYKPVIKYAILQSLKYASFCSIMQINILIWSIVDSKSFEIHYIKAT